MARHVSLSFFRIWDRWFSRIALSAGLWMVVSPWALGVGVTTAAGFSAITCGAVIVAISTAITVWQARLSRQGMFVLGLIAVAIASIALAAPFLLDFAGPSRWSALVSGALVIIDIGCELLRLRV